MLYFYIFLAIFLIITASFSYYISFSSQAGHVFKATTIKTAKKMVELAKVNKNHTVLDLGSGDGILLIETAKKGAKAIGYEIDPLLVMQSHKKIKQARLSKQIKVKLKSFWQADFNKADIIMVYLFPKYLKKLKHVLEEKLTRSVLVVSNDYQFPNKKHFKKHDNIYFYKFGPN